MKEYTYHGQQASFVMRTSAGSLTLAQGKAVNVDTALHDAVSLSPIVKALIQSGDLSVVDLSPTPIKAAGKSSATNKSDDAKKQTMPQLKKQLDDLGIVYAADATREQLDALLQPKQDS